MPVHSFQDPDSDHTVDIYVPSSASSLDHNQQLVDGKLYKRVWSAPLAARDIITASASREDYLRTTEGKRYKVGEMQDLAAEMREHRKDRNGGYDEVTEAYYKRYERDNGEEHDDVKARRKLEQTNARLAEWGISLKP